MPAVLTALSRILLIARAERLYSDLFKVMEQTILSKVNAPSLFFSSVCAFELLTELMQCL